MLVNDLQAIETGKEVICEESNFLKPSAEPRTYRIVKKPLYDNQQKIIGVSGVAHDITEEKRLRETVEEQKQLLSVILDNVEAYVYMKDAERRFLYVNSKVANLFELPVEQIIGQKEQDILPPKTAEHFHLSDSQALLTQEIQRVEETVVDNGETYHYLSVKVPVSMSGKKSLIGFSTDVTEIYKLKEEFKRLANTDELTAIYNRRFFIKQSENAFSGFKRQRAHFGVVTFDVDFFKQVNDEFGHPVGDEVLKGLAKIVSALLRQEDIFARIGGEEFAILLPYSDLPAAMCVAQRIQKTVNSSLLCGTRKISITVSIGVTTFTSEDSSFDDVFSRVDKALYIAKEQGRDCVVSLP
jgi:diguanylate cyclase (GGDEF)-like protein/PAS domain S-box-containing protein